MCRLAGGLRIAGTLAAVGIVLVLLTAGVSAAEFAAGVAGARLGSGGPPRVTASGTGLTLLQNFSLTNNGFYPISALTLRLLLSNASVPPAVVAAGGAGPVTIAGGGTQTLHVLVLVPFVSPAVGYLLTHDSRLAGRVWMNASYVSLFRVSADTTFNWSWGAPFSGLSVRASSPSPQPNGTTEVTVWISFSNNATGLDLEGSLRVSVAPPSSSPCYGTSFPISAPGGPFLLSQNLWLPSGCGTSGGTLQATYVGAGGGPVFAFPPEALP